MSIEITKIEEETFEPVDTLEGEFIPAQQKVKAFTHLKDMLEWMGVINPKHILAQSGYNEKGEFIYQLNWGVEE